MFDLETAIWNIVGYNRNKEETDELLRKWSKGIYLKGKMVKKQKIEKEG